MTARTTSSSAPGGGGDTSGRRDVFVTDVASGETVNLTAGGNGNRAIDAYRGGQISADGSPVLLYSYATNLEDGRLDANGTIYYIFVADIA